MLATVIITLTVLGIFFNTISIIFEKDEVKEETTITNQQPIYIRSKLFDS